MDRCRAYSFSRVWFFSVVVFVSFFLNTVFSCYSATAAESAKDSDLEKASVCTDASFTRWDTGVCAKIGGFVSYQENLKGSVFTAKDVALNSILGSDELIRPTDTPSDFVGSWRDLTARANMDIRSDSQYGTIRSFAELSGSFDSTDPSADPFSLRHAYIEVAGFLLGKTTATWIHADSSPDVNSSAVSDPFPRVVQFRYTVPLEAGIAISIALEDADPYLGRDDSSRVSDPLEGAKVVFKNNEPSFFLPVLSAALKIQQSWGTAQLSGFVLRRGVSWTSSDSGETTTQKVFSYGALAGILYNVTSDDAVGGHLVYTSGIDPVFVQAPSSSTAPYRFIWKKSEAGIYDATSLSTLGGVAWVRHAWSDELSTTLGAAYSSTANYSSFESELDSKNAKTDRSYPSAISLFFMSNSYNIDENLSLAVDIGYGRKVWKPRDPDRSGAFGVISLTRNF